MNDGSLTCCMDINAHQTKEDHYLTQLRTFFKNLNHLEWILLSQPIIDLLTALLMTQNRVIASIGLLSRMLFLAYFATVIVFRSERRLRRFSLAYVLLVALFAGVSFWINFIHKDASILWSEFRNFSKMFYFPIALLAIMNLSFTTRVRNLAKILSINAALITVFLILPTLFKVNFSSYSTDKFGSVGWFFSPNEISAILTILLPYVIYEAWRRHTLQKALIVIVLIMSGMLLLGTKVPLVGIVLVTLIMMLPNIKPALQNLNLKQFERLIPIFLAVVFVVSFAAITQGNNIKTQSQWIDQVYEDNLHNDPQSGTNFDPSLDLYRTLDSRVVKVINLVFSSRDRYVMALGSVMNDATLDRKLFGLGISDADEVYKFGSDNVVEVDFLDVFFMFGILGFMIYFTPLVYLMLKFESKLKESLRHISKNMRHKVNFIVLGLVAGISVFSGHVLSAPSVSIYVAFILVDILSEGFSHE